MAGPQQAPNTPRQAVPNGDGNYNIIFITVDQEHYFHNYEYPESTGYRAQELLRELGTSFEKHYACSNMSTSSRSTIVTGRHIPHTGMLDNTDFQWQGAMDESIPTVGDMMREAGYYSAIKGKWHMGDASIMRPGEAQLTDLDGYGFSDWGGRDYIGSVHEGHEVDPIIVSEATDWLDTVGRPLNGEGRSFFLNVNLVNPHDIMNYDAAGRQSGFMKLAGKPDDPLYEKTYPAEAPASWDFDLTDDTVPEALRLYRSHWGKFVHMPDDKALWKDYQDYYYNCIQEMDNNLMKLLDYLSEHDMWRNTIVVFTSDHGEMHGSHALCGKGGFLYENNIHVPLIIVHPELAGGGSVSSVTSHVDLAPTFVDMTRLAPEEKERITGKLAGKSLLSLMNGREKRVRDGSLFCFEMLSMTAVSFSLGANGKPAISLDPKARGLVRGLTTERYKFARYFSLLDYNLPETMEELFAHNDVQLFDLENDPEELVNLAAEPEKHKELILSLNEQLNRLITQEIGADKGQYMQGILKALQQMGK